MLESQDLLKTKVDEAVQVLLTHESKGSNITEYELPTMDQVMEETLFCYKDTRRIGHLRGPLRKIDEPKIWGNKVKERRRDLCESGGRELVIKEVRQEYERVVKMLKNKVKERRRDLCELGGQELVFKEEGQEYECVVKMLGCGRLDAYCFDGVRRLCQIRGQLKGRGWIHEGDTVLLSLREYQDDRADVVMKYTSHQVQQVILYGELPVITEFNDVLPCYKHAVFANLSKYVFCAAYGFDIWKRKFPLYWKVNHKSKRMRAPWWSISRWTKKMKKRELVKRKRSKIFNRLKRSSKACAKQNELKQKCKNSYTHPHQNEPNNRHRPIVSKLKSAQEPVPARLLGRQPGYQGPYYRYDRCVEKVVKNLPSLETSKRMKYMNHDYFAAMHFKACDKQNELEQKYAAIKNSKACAKQKELKQKYVAVKNSKTCTKQNELRKKDVAVKNSSTFAKQNEPKRKPTTNNRSLGPTVTIIEPSLAPAHLRGNQQGHQGPCRCDKCGKRLKTLLGLETHKKVMHMNQNDVAVKNSKACAKQNELKQKDVAVKNSKTYAKQNELRQNDVAVNSSSTCANKRM